MSKKSQPTVPDTERAATLLLFSLRLLHGLGSQAMKDTGLRPPQVAFLGFLHRAGTLNMGMISKLTNVTVSVATRFIARLESKGLLERIPDENDRRVVLVRLTDEGNQLAGNVFKAYNHKLDEALRGIDQDDLEVFLAVLSHINEKMAQELPFEHISEMIAVHLHDEKEGIDENK